MRLTAILIGLLFVGVGAVGLAVPSVWYETARVAQTMPWLYLAAAVRLVIGTALYWAAPVSRVPIGISVLAAVIFTSGLLTPLAGSGAAQMILDWWKTVGSVVVRAFASLSLLIGAFVLYAFIPPRARS
jgi:hypothetical protein